jgi:tripartite-type tricarboxylate transporter receptor subunit TctC
MRPVALLIGGVLLGLAVAAGSSGAAAQSRSGKPIRIVVQSPPGAAADVLGRIAGEWLGKRTGAPIVIENRGGAGGAIALEAVAKAEPDGHTLLLATNGSITINRALFKKEPIDTLTDIVPVAPLAFNPDILVVNGKLPAQTAGEFIALAKSQPGKINYGSAGAGSTPHLAVALFARLAGIELVHVPYRGMAPAITDLVAGNVQVVAIGNATVAPFVETGALRVLAAATPRRLPYLPNVPSAGEIGLPTWEVDTWYGLFAPRGTAKDLVDTLNAHFAALLDDPANKKRFDESFYDARKMSADEFAALVKAEAGKWERVVRETGVEAQ